MLEEPHTSIQNPEILVKKRGRPTGSKNKKTITRERSHFEYVEGENAGNVEELDTTAELVAPNKPNKRRSRNFKKGVEIAKKGVEIAAPRIY